MMVEKCNGLLIMTLNLSKIAKPILISLDIPPSITIHFLSTSVLVSVYLIPLPPLASTSKTNVLCDLKLISQNASFFCSVSAHVKCFAGDNGLHRVRNEARNTSEARAIQNSQTKPSQTVTCMFSTYQFLEFRWSCEIVALCHWVSGLHRSAEVWTLLPQQHGATSSKTSCIPSTTLL